MKEKPKLSEGSEPVEGQIAGYYDEAEHGERFLATLEEVYTDRKGRKRYKVKHLKSHQIITLPDHYNLNQKMAALVPGPAVYEFVNCGRTLTNEKGEAVKDQSGAIMYEWLIGRTTFKAPTDGDADLPF